MSSKYFFLLLVCIPHYILPAAPPLSGITSKVQFDNELEFEKVPVEYLDYLVTAKNIIADLGAPETIPLHNITKKNFVLLMELAKIVRDNNNNQEALIPQEEIFLR